PVPLPLLHPFPTRRSSDLSTSARLSNARRNQGTPRRARIAAGSRRSGSGPAWRWAAAKALRILGIRVLAWALVRSPLKDYVTGQDRKSTRLNSSHLGISYA